MGFILEIKGSDSLAFGKEMIRMASVSSGLGLMELRL